MSSGSGSNVGKTSARSAETPTSKTQEKEIQVMTGTQVLKGKCSYAGCPYDEKSSLSTASGVVQIKNTNYFFHPECHAKFAEQLRSEGRNDPAVVLQDQKAQEVTLQETKPS